MGIRPEDIEVSTSKKSESDLEIVVESVEPLGSNTVVTSLVDGKVFRLVLPPDRGVEPGNRLWLEWQPNKMHFFEKKSGDLLL